MNSGQLVVLASGILLIGFSLLDAPWVLHYHVFAVNANYPIRMPIFAPPVEWGNLVAGINVSLDSSRLFAQLLAIIGGLGACWHALRTRARDEQDETQEFRLRIWSRSH